MGVRDLVVKLRLQDRQFQQGMKKSTKSLKSFDQAAGQAGQGLGGLATIMGAAGFAYFGQQAAGAVVELAKLGAQSERLETAFQDLATQGGGSADAILSAIKRASSGTISEMDAMAAANRGMMLGLGANAQQWEQLTEVARYRARAMGLTTTQALLDITTGLGRMSPLILDNLGIVIDAETTYGQYAESIGKAASALTDAEKKQALMTAAITEGQAMIAEAGGIARDTADDFEAMQASIDNLKVSVGTLAAPGIANLARNLYVLSESIQGNVTPAHELSREVEEQEGKVRLLGGAWVDLTDEMKEARDIYDLWMGARPISEDIPEQIKKTGDEAARSKPKIEGLVRAYMMLADETKAMVAERTHLDIMGRDPYEDQTGALEALAKQEADNTAKAEKNAEDVAKANEDAAKRTTRAWEDSIAAQQRAYDDLKSTIRSALQATTVTQADLDATAAGTYVDKWDEAARRLDAIAARGFGELQRHGDWAAILKIPPEVLAGSEAQLKQWAQQTSDAVRNLERPDLLNLDAAVEAVKQQLQQKHAIELSLDIIAAEVMKDMPSVSKEDVAQMLGVEAPEIPIMPVLNDEQKAAFMESMAAEGGLQVPVQFGTLEGGTLEDAGKEMGTTVVGGLIFSITQMGVATTAASTIAKDAADKKEALKNSGTALWDKVHVGIMDAMQNKEYAKEFARVVAPYVADVLRGRGFDE